MSFIIACHLKGCRSQPKQSLKMLETGFALCSSLPPMSPLCDQNYYTHQEIYKTHELTLIFFNVFLMVA